MILAELSAALGAALLLLAPEGRSGGGDAGASGSNRWRLTSSAGADGAEARCDYDVSRGPVRVTVEPSAGSLSVSVVQADGRALFKADERTAPEGVDLIVALRGQAAPRGARVVVSSTPRGVVLERRPALTPEQFAAARSGDICAAVGLDFPAPRR